MGEGYQRGVVADTGEDRFLHEPDRGEQHEVAAVVVTRDDGTCTVAWGPAWRTFDALPGTWPNRQEAMRAIARVVARTVVWRQTEANLWEAQV
jgi:hypothetical protein